MIINVRKVNQRTFYGHVLCRKLLVITRGQQWYWAMFPSIYLKVSLHIWPQRDLRSSMLESRDSSAFLLKGTFRGPTAAVHFFPTASSGKKSACLKPHNAPMLGGVSKWMGTVGELCKSCFLAPVN